MVHPNYIRPVGGLALDRYDAQNHFDGVAFRHNSDQVDVNPSVSINGTNVITVAQALSVLSSYVAQDILAGSGFIAIPDGYDTYHASDVASSNPPPNSNFPYDSTTPSVDGILNDLLNNPANPQYHRVRDGGIVFLKAGTYIITNTVNVPPGTIIMGEGFGTKIVNKTSSPRPLFQIKADGSKTFGSTPFATDPGSDPTTKFMATRETKLFNLVIADNFVEPIVSGDTTYQQPKNVSIFTTIASGSNGQSLPQATINVISTTGFASSGMINVITNAGSQLVSYTGTTLTTFTGCSGGAGTMSTGNAVGQSFPLVSVEEGANFSCELVRFLGRVSYSGPNVNALTAYAIKTDPTVPINTGTIITVRNCFFDGFSQTVRTTSLGGPLDYFVFTNNYVRTYGFLNGDTSSDPNNTFFNLTSANINVQSNYLWANTAVSGADTVQSLVWLNNGTPGALTINQFPRITVANNNVSTNQALSSQNAVFLFLKRSTSTTLTVSLNPKFTSIVFGNNYTGGNAGSDIWSVDLGNTGIPQLTVGFNPLNHKGTFSVGTNLNFDVNMTSPLIQQTVATGATQNLTVQGQSTIGSFQGGNIDITGGTGTTDGYVDLNSAASGIRITGVLSGNFANNDPFRTGITFINAGSGSPVITLNANQYANQIIQVTGSTASVTLILPTIVGYIKYVANKTSASGPVLVETLSGTPVSIAAGSSAWVYCDGTNIVQ